MKRIKLRNGRSSIFVGHEIVRWNPDLLHHKHIDWIKPQIKAVASCKLFEVVDRIIPVSMIINE